MVFFVSLTDETKYDKYGNFFNNTIATMSDQC